MISARNNVYLPFPMLKMKVNLLDRLMAEQPEYVIRPKDSKENKRGAAPARALSAQALWSFPEDLRLLH
ncbi:MAG: hypothetical protein HC902_00165 [Calothrix sp. SM1_5_4]|nr:hypothetical protein [Calothrix sp. SM1_5_4]